MAFLSPSIASTTALFSELNRDTSSFKRFISANSHLVTDVSQRANDLAGLVDNLATTTGAIGRQGNALQDAIRQLPEFMRRANTTFVNLRATLDDLTPLVDERTVGALLDVRGRGFDVAVLELDPVAMVAARPDELGRLAHRLWLLRREALRERFRAAGIPIASWNEERPLEAALEEVAASRRHAGRVRA